MKFEIVIAEIHMSSAHVLSQAEAVSVSKLMVQDVTSTTYFDIDLSFTLRAIRRQRRINIETANK